MTVSWTTLPTPVYPRVCGGTDCAVLPALLFQGLSPCVRGNRGYDRIDTGRAGSIPVCAGEPHPLPPRLRPTGVYPRVCGGTSLPPDAYASANGLSPRVRGNRTPGEILGEPDGSIPACAGEPGSPAPATTLGGVYPRVCGGTAGGNAWYRITSGLSPRVRGNPLVFSTLAIFRRSIPACAGEPPIPCAAG